MHKYLFALVVALAGALGLSGCGGSRAENIGTAGGAVGGGAVGSAVSGGSTMGTLGGAAVGGVVGHEAGREYDKRNK
jgi:osmotically inducible lipoprotein OsmB